MTTASLGLGEPPTRAPRSESWAGFSGFVPPVGGGEIGPCLRRTIGNESKRIGTVSITNGADVNDPGMSRSNRSAVTVGCPTCGTTVNAPLPPGFGLVDATESHPTDDANRLRGTETSCRNCGHELELYYY